MKSIISAVVILVGLLLLAGCGPDHGVVVDKSHTDGYTSTIMVSCGTKGQMCPSVQYHPPSWSLLLDEDPVDTEKPHWRGVNEGIYNACKIGDTYDYNKSTKTESCEQ